MAGQLLNQRVLRRADKEPGIQLAGLQRGRCWSAAEQLPVRRVLCRGDGVGRQNRRAGGQGTAAWATQGQAQWLQVGNPVEVQTLAIEQPQWLVIDRAEAAQTRALGGGQLLLQTALHQGNLHLAGLCQQALQVVAGTRAGHQGQLEALLGQGGFQLLGKLAVTAARKAGGHLRMHRRWRGDKIKQRTHQRGKHRQRPQVGQQDDFQVF